MTARPLFLATALAITTAAPAAPPTRAGDKPHEVPFILTFTEALGDHPGLVRLGPATGIDAVCDEYLDKRFGIKTIVLTTKDK